MAESEANYLKINQSEASLLLVMLGRSDHSAIRPGIFSGEDFLKLVESLKQIAREGE